jgi:hypothetical protein
MITMRTYDDQISIPPFRLFENDPLGRAEKARALLPARTNNASSRTTRLDGAFTESAI